MQFTAKFLREFVIAGLMIATVYLGAILICGCWQ